MKARSLLRAAATALLLAALSLSAADATPLTAPRVFIQVSRASPAHDTSELDDPLLTLVRDGVEAFYSVEPATAPLGRLGRSLEQSLGDVTLALQDQVVYYWVWDAEVGEFFRVCRPVPTLVIFADTDPNPIVISVIQEV